MKKLLIALAAIGSVNAFASDIKITLQNDTACSVKVNGTPYAPGASEEVPVSADGTYSVVEYTSYSDGSSNCQLPASNTSVAIAGKTVDGKSSFDLFTGQGSSARGITKEFISYVQLDGGAQEKVTSERSFNQPLSDSASHTFKLTIKGGKDQSGKIPAADKPKQPSDDHQYPKALPLTVYNVTSCPMQVAGTQIEKGGHATVSSSALYQVVEHTGARCDISATTIVSYTPSTVTPKSDGQIDFDQSQVNVNDQYFVVNASSYGQTATVDSKDSHMGFMSHKLSDETDKDNPSATLTITAHVPIIKPDAGFYPDGKGKVNDKFIIGSTTQVRDSNGTVNTYKCKVAGWCDMAAYTPGTAAGNTAWDLANPATATQGSGRSFW